MGDRTTVTLTVLASQKEAAKELFDTAAVEDWGYRELHEYLFYEVNYGELEFLDKLQAAGIAYASRWDAGDGYGAGTKFCRFTSDGDSEIKEVYDTGVNPELTPLLACIDDHAALKKFILAHRESITPLPWDNQEEYGKRHRAKQLITP